MLPIRVFAGVLVLAVGIVLAVLYFVLSWVMFGMSMSFYYVGRFFDLKLWKGRAAPIAWAAVSLCWAFKQLHKHVRDLLTWHVASTRYLTDTVLNKKYSNESRKV